MSTVHRSVSFEETRWSLVLHARSGDSVTANRALEELCQLYWFPLYGFIRRQGHSSHDAEDFTQEFLSRILERRDFDRVDREKGRLRSYLLGALKHFLANEATRERAQRRGGGKVISLDREWAENQLSLEPATDEWSPDRLFDRRWALTQIDAARNQVLKRFESRGKSDQFRVLEKFLAWNSGENYEAAAMELGMSESTVRVAVHRLRERFGKALTDEIANTVEGDADLARELGEFSQLLG